MQTIIGFIALVFGIIQLILFFKIWGMTNDIREIKEKYLSSGTSNAKSTSSSPEGFNVGDLVVEIATDKQMRIKSITEDGKYSCYTGGGTTHVGDFNYNEIKPF